MSKLNNFNLLISTSRYNEINAKAEIWFLLLLCGDKYPIISSVEFPGIISAVTSLDVKKVVKKINNILTEDPYFFQFILKIIPIDFVCDLNLNSIKTLVANHYEEHIQRGQTFRIDLKRRKSKIIDRESFIKNLANIINNKVDLNNPDKIIRFEILSNLCGISFLEPNDIINAKLSQH